MKDMSNVIQEVMTCADPQQTEEYYNTTKLMPIGKYMSDSGLGWVQVDVEQLINLLQSKEVKTVDDVVYLALDAAVEQDLEAYYMGTTAKLLVDYMAQSGVANVEVNIANLIKALEVMK